MKRALCTALALVVSASACSRGIPSTPSAGRIPPVRLAASTGRVDHVVRISGEPVAAQGTTLGVAVNVELRPWVDLNVRSATGSLTASENSQSNHELSELEAGVSMLVLPWLAATVAAEARSYEGTLATQRWTALRTGAEVRMDLANGARGIIRASAFPKVSVDGLPSPNLAIGGGTGIELRRRRLFASLMYSIDRYDFPAGAAGRRVEQLSSLMLQAGWRFGR